MRNWKSHGSPMAVPWEQHGSTMGSWMSHGSTTEVLWELQSHTEVPWKSHGNSMGTLRKHPRLRSPTEQSHGAGTPMVTPRYSHGTLLHGTSVGPPWDVHGTTEQCFRGTSIGLPWDLDGTSMRLQCFHRTCIGLAWDFHGTSTGIP